MILLAALFIGGSAWAQVPASLTHQGRLADEEGQPITGQVEMTFTIYDAASGGALLWEGNYEVEADEQGFYTVELGGDSNPIDAMVLTGTKTWVGITVDGTELEPRMALNSVPYAVVAGQAKSVADGAVDSDALAPGFSLSGDQIGDVQWDQIDDVPGDLADGDDDTLGGMSCTADDVAVFDGTSWNCTSQPSYDGADFAISDQSCGPGDVVTGIAADGSVQCAPDANTDTTYTAGQGLSVNNEEFSLDTSYTDTLYAHSDQSCPTGEVVVGLDTSGGVLCSPDQDTQRSDSDITGVIANEDRYVEKSGSTMSGDLSTSGDINTDGDVEVGGDLKMNGESFDMHRMRVWRTTNNEINYVDPNGNTHTLTISDPSQQYVSGRIGYEPGKLFFNTEGAPLPCTVLHAEDDAASNNFGLAWATDGGNGMSSVWGNSTTQTFMFQREGSNGIPIATHSAYHLLCM